MTKRYKKWAEENKEHLKEYKRKYHQENKRYVMDRTFRLKYGISLDEVEILKEKQNNTCALCPKKGKLYIDHDHKTGKFRGLLCVHCNTRIAQIENLDWVKRALQYLGLTLK